ncbi:MAG: hypothetical protein QXO51_07895 [Halobacteria archaeon]
MKCAVCGCDTGEVRASGRAYCDHGCCGPFAEPAQAGAEGE